MFFLTVDENILSIRVSILYCLRLKMKFHQLQCTKTINFFSWTIHVIAYTLQSVGVANAQKLAIYVLRNYNNSNTDDVIAKS